MSELSTNIAISIPSPIDLTLDKTTSKSAPTTLQSIISGGVGGAFMAIVGHPLDLIKVRQQAISNAAIQKESVTSILTQILKREGPRGLYRGLLAPLLSSTPVFAVEYASFETCQTLLKWGYGMPKQESLSIYQVALAGAIAAFPATLIVSPVERIKCMLQVAGEGSKPLGLVQAIKEVGGIKGLYRGTLATLLRDSTGGVLYFATYIGAKRLLSKETKEGESQLNPAAIMLAGGLAGMANWMVCIPADVIKSRQQTELISKSFLVTFRELIRQEGIQGLFKGLTPALLRAFPANAACFLGVEASLYLLLGKNY
ncbi:mitochondrial carrier [Neoconidiobolus thromboides FSU 785]|nr:mitochondrial carrier [Neoconidiobolus thromboides FSU 785]